MLACPGPSVEECFEHDDDETDGSCLNVLLSPVTNPGSRTDVTAAGYTDLGKFKGNRGVQNYEIPGDFQLSPGELSVVIYCVPFHVPFASTTLTSRDHWLIPRVSARIPDRRERRPRATRWTASDSGESGSRVGSDGVGQSPCSFCGFSACG